MENLTILGSINAFDIAIVLIIGTCMLLAYHKGLVLSVFRLFSFIAAIVLANTLYPFVSKFLRNTGFVYDGLTKYISDSIFSQHMQAQSIAAQNELVGSLNLPRIITDSILKNSNPVIYKILEASGIQEYIVKYIANICLNIISMILVFILVSILMAIIASSLDIVTRLPVIKQFNKMGGLLMGFLQGTLFIWIIFVGLSFFISAPGMSKYYLLLKESLFAHIFYENNLIMNFILNIH